MGSIEGTYNRIKMIDIIQWFIRCNSKKNSLPLNRKWLAAKL